MPCTHTQVFSFYLIKTSEGGWNYEGLHWTNKNYKGVIYRSKKTQESRENVSHAPQQGVKSSTVITYICVTLPCHKLW